MGKRRFELVASISWVVVCKTATDCATIDYDEI